MKYEVQRGKLSGMKKNTMIRIISALLILLFTYAALNKLFDYQEFNKQLTYSPFISSIAPLLAWSLPAVEILIAVLLAVRATRLWGLLGSLVLMFLFTGYLLIMLNFAKMEDIPCPCGGILGEMSWDTHVVFNLVFIALSLAGIILHRKQRVLVRSLA